MWFIGVEVEQETSAPPPKKNPGSTPGLGVCEAIRFFVSNRLRCLFNSKQSFLIFH